MAGLVSDGTVTVIVLCIGVAANQREKENERIGRNDNSFILSCFLHYEALCTESLKITHAIDRCR